MTQSIIITTLKRLCFYSAATCLIAVLLVPVTVLSGNDQTRLKWPHEISDLPVDPSLIFGRLPNGFGYVLKENREPKNRVSMHLVVSVGSFHEADDQLGVAHFLEHMQFNGSAHFKPGELVKYFQTIGMQFGPDANAHTGFQETVFDVVLPNGDAKSIAGGLMVMKDYADGALLLPSEVDRERGVILAEKRSRDSVDYRTFVSTLQFEFPEARISKRLPIGDEAVLKTVNREAIKSFYDTWYRPEKMVLVMVGDFDVNSAASLIKDTFSEMLPRTLPASEPDSGRIQHVGDKFFNHYEPEDGNTTVSIETVRMIKKTNDSLALQKQLLLRKMADSIVQNRLAELIQKPGTPFTAARINSGQYLQDIEFAEISATCDPRKWKESISLIEQILRNALEHGFNQSELERVRKDYLANLENAVRQSSTRKSNDLAKEINSSIVNSRVFMSPQQEQELFAPFITSIHVTEIHEAFQANWPGAHRLFLVTGNALIDQTSKTAESIMASVIRESREHAVEKPVEIQQVQFPYLKEPVGVRSGIVGRNEVTDLSITQIDYENGIRLNLKQTDFEADKVHVLLSFGRGRSDEPIEKPGLSMLAEAVLNESGFGGITKDELQRALAGKEWKLKFDVAEDHFSFIGNSTSRELLLLFQLLHAHLQDPGFRSEAFKLATDRFGQMYQSLSREIDGAMQLYGQRFFAGGDNRFGFPPKDLFDRLTLSDVRDWLTPLLKDAPVEVSVVGDFEVEKVIEWANIYFGTLDKRKPIGPDSRSDLPYFPLGKTLSIKVETQIPKGLIVIGYPTADFWDIKRTRRLSVLGDIVSEKLRETVREKLGISYSPYAYNRPSRAYAGYGLLQALVYTDPDKADVVVREVKKIGLELSRKGISAEELSRSVKPMMTNITEMRRTNVYWLKSVLNGSRLHPEQLDWSRNILSDFSAITTQDINALAKKYLVSKKAGQIIIRPAVKE